LFQSEISESELLAHFAIKQDNRPDAADIKKEMEKKKNFYLDALVKRGIALCTLERLRTYFIQSPLSVLKCKFLDRAERF
jgi:hypothetical protein